MDALLGGVAAGVGLREVLLDCHACAEAHVARNVGDAKTAMAEHALELVLTQPVTDRQGIRVCLARW